MTPCPDAPRAAGGVFGTPPAAACGGLKGGPRVHARHAMWLAITARSSYPDVSDWSFTARSVETGGSGRVGQAAFLPNPTACTTEPVKTRLEATSWEGGSDASEATAYLQIEGCDLLQGVAVFNQRIELKPDETPGLKPRGTTRCSRGYVNASRTPTSP